MKEDREKERDEHGAFFCYTRKEREVGGREGTAECQEAKDKGMEKGSFAVAIRSHSVERLRGGIHPAIIVLQLTLSGEFCKFGSFTYPKTGSPVNRVNGIKGKVLTQKATAPLSIPEQPAFFDDWNLIPIARPNRKPDTTLL